jgi:hypothetical protein
VEVVVGGVVVDGVDVMVGVIVIVVDVVVGAVVVIGVVVVGGAKYKQTYGSERNRK